MFGQVVAMLTEVLTNIGIWFALVFENSGMTIYYLAAIFIVLLSRYIVSPLVGRSGSSDTVKQYKGGKKNG